MKKELLAVAMLLFAGGNLLAQPHVNDGTSYLMNQPLDMSTDFRDLSNTLFFADHLESFDAKSGEGLVNWKRGHLMPRQAFNTNGAQPRKMRMLDFPFTAYENDPNLKFKIDFVTPRTVRIRMLTTPVEPKPAASIMLAKEPGRDGSWKVIETNDKIIYSSDYGTIQINKNPWRIVLKDKAGRILSQTAALSDADSTQVKYTPFCFVKRGSDNARRINPVFTLTADEMIFGCGESATGLNKAGQKVNLFVTDPQGPETDQMYKPIPFFMSNRGYGMFMHTSAPVTCDFGATYIGLNKMFMGDENLDLFVFFGEPKDILDEYTDLVGKPGMPPLWSFGTWMSRITYFSEKEGYDVAANIQFQRIFVINMYAAVIHAAGVAGQVGAAGLDDLRVHLHKVNAFHAVIAGQLPHNAAVARTDDENILGVFVYRHRHVGDHLVVDELVALGQHDVAVQRQHAAKLRCFKNVDALIVALLGVKLAVDPDAVLDIGGVKLRKPHFHCKTSLSGQHVQAQNVGIFRSGHAAALGLGVLDIV